MRYREYERRLDLARIAVNNRQAIVAAGIYEEPISTLNEAVTLYSELLHLIVTEPETAVKTNTDLYEEWKRIFGKIETTSTSDTPV